MEFKDINKSFSTEEVLNFMDWRYLLTVHTDSYDKKLSDVISQNNKPIHLFSERLVNAQKNCITIEK